MKKELLNIKIGNRKIGPGHPCFIIAEISGNHNQNFQRAKKLVETACECGVDAVKLQTYTANTMTIDCNKKWFKIGKNNKWSGQTLYELYKKAYTPWEWQPKLKKIAEKKRVMLFSTPFDNTAVDFLEKMKVLAYKIASFEITDLELLKRVAKTKKPVIMSRGLASANEVKQAVKTLREHGASQIAVLHCIIAYPAEAQQMNLATIPDIAKKFKVVSGLSDHSLSPIVPIVGIALGASIIEKHFTLSRKQGGPDSDFSLEPQELKQLVQDIREAEKAIGSACYNLDKKETQNIVFRRSLFAVENIKKGEKLTQENVRCIRPGYGLAPEYLGKILSKTARQDIEKGTSLAWNLIKKSFSRHPERARRRSEGSPRRLDDNRSQPVG